MHRGSADTAPGLRGLLAKHVSAATAFTARLANRVTSFTLQLAANLDQRLALTNRTNSQPVSTFTASGFYPFFLTGLLFAHFEPLRTVS